MSLELVHWTDPILRTKLEKFDFYNSSVNPVELYNELGAKLIELGGLGLAANQVGWKHRFFVLATNPIQAFFNPIIVDASKATIKLDEACLSMPNLKAPVTRAAAIKLRYADPTGTIQTQRFDGMTARAVQHELDHLDGKLFTNHLTSLELMLAIKKSKRKYIIGDVR